jgi:hypothetical protein
LVRPPSWGDAALMRDRDLAPCPYCQGHAASVATGCLMGTPGPGQPEIHQQYFSVMCDVCGCTSEPQRTMQAASESRRQGPSDGDFRAWFVNLDQETRH